MFVAVSFRSQSKREMALAEICGLTDFDLRNRETALDTDVSKFSKNFWNNAELAVPPFYNVS